MSVGEALLSHDRLTYRFADRLMQQPPQDAGVSPCAPCRRPERSSRRGCRIGDKAGVRPWTRTSPLLRAVAARSRRGHEERRNRATSAQANDLVLGQRLRPFAPPSDMTS
jgi:hypothetical protein